MGRAQIIQSVVAELTGVAACGSLGQFMRSREQVRGTREIHMDFEDGGETLYVVETMDGSFYRFTRAQILQRFGTLGAYEGVLRDRKAFDDRHTN